MMNPNIVHGVLIQWIKVWNMYTVYLWIYNDVVHSVNAGHIYWCI